MAGGHRKGSTLREKRAEHRVSRVTEVVAWPSGLCDASACGRVSRRVSPLIDSSERRQARQLTGDNVEKE